MEAVYSFEISSFAYKITLRLPNPDQHNMNLYDREILKCCKYHYFREFCFTAAEAEEMHRENSAIAHSGTVHDIFCPQLSHVTATPPPLFYFTRTQSRYNNR